MKTGWQIKSLGEVAELIRTGKTPSTTREDYFNGDIEWYTPGDIGESKYLSTSVRTLTQKSVADGKALIFPAETLLITCIGNIGRVGIVKKPSSANQQITGIKFIKAVDTSYAYYWFRKNYSLLADKANQAVVPILNNSQLREINFEYPSLKIQKQIAEILEKVDQAKQKRKEANQLTEHFLQAAFIEMFGDPVNNPEHWEITNLGSVISTLSDYHSNGSYESLRNNVQLLDSPDYAYVVRTTDLEKGDFENNVKYFSESAYEYLSKSKIYGGEIIINKIGSAGKVYLMPNLNRKVSLGMNQFALRINNKADNVFIYYLLKSNYGESIIGKKIQGAVTKTITKDAVRSLEIPLPPLSLQQQFAGLVQEVEALKEKQKQTEIELDNLFNSLMQKAFRGELV